MLVELNSYHQNTKHSYLSVRNNPNRVDWNNPPNRFKNYPQNFKRIHLNLDDENHNFLYLISGISAKKTYPGIEYYLRINPSAGALYPNELYFQVRNINGFENGIYHLEVSSSSAVLLQKIDENEGIENFLGLDFSVDGFIFFISSVYFRSSWKYKNRAFRYCMLDAGHLLGCIEASSYLFDKEFEILYDFPKKSLNEFFSFDEKEFFSSICLVGNKIKGKKDDFSLLIPTLDGSSYDEDKLSFFIKNELIEKTYMDTLQVKDKNSEDKKALFNFQKQKFQDTIFNRRSIREFSKQAISNLQFEAILNVLNQPIKSDCNEEIDIFYTINRVEGLKIGLYKNGILIKNGDFSKKAGYLCLEQDLGESSAVTFFLATRSKNYQEAYQKAGLIGHRLYLSSNYLEIGCSGIGAYYDDEVCEFLQEQTMILYALAIGN